MQGNFVCALTSQMPPVRITTVGLCETDFGKRSCRVDNMTRERRLSAIGVVVVVALAAGTLTTTTLAGAAEQNQWKLGHRKHRAADCRHGGRAGPHAAGYSG